MSRKLTSAQRELRRLTKQAKPAKRHKYGAKPQVIDGHRFASKREAQHYLLLKGMEKAGRIIDLVLQPRFYFPPQGWEDAQGNACAGATGSYYADFGFIWAKGEDAGNREFHDTKGYSKEPYFRMKMRCMKFFYPSVKLVLV